MIGRSGRAAVRTTEDISMKDERAIPAAGREIDARLTAPPSKSVTQRALVAAALAGGRASISRPAAGIARSSCIERASVVRTAARPDRPIIPEVRPSERAAPPAPRA